MYCIFYKVKNLDNKDNNYQINIRILKLEKINSKIKIENYKRLLKHYMIKLIKVKIN